MTSIPTDASPSLPTGAGSIQDIVVGDCLYRFKNHANWLLPSVDIDEYIHVKDGNLFGGGGKCCSRRLTFFLCPTFGTRIRICNVSSVPQDSTDQKVNNQVVKCLMIIWVRAGTQL